MGPHGAWLPRSTRAGLGVALMGTIRLVGRVGRLLAAGPRTRRFAPLMARWKQMGKKGGKKTKLRKLSRVKINWNRLVVSVGWWLACAGGTWDIPPLLGPSAAAHPIAPSHGSTPAMGQIHGENTTTRSQSPQSHHWPAPSTTPVPSAPLLGLRFAGEHLLVLKKFSEFQEHYVTLTRK